MLTSLLNVLWAETVIHYILLEKPHLYGDVGAAGPAQCELKWDDGLLQQSEKVKILIANWETPDLAPFHQ